MVGSVDWEERDGGTFFLFELLKEPVAFLVGLEVCLGILQIFFRFPSVFHSGIALPFYKKGVSFSLSSMGNDGLNFVLRFTFY